MDVGQYSVWDGITCSGIELEGLGVVLSGVAYWEVIIRLAVYFSVWITVLHKLLI